MLAATLTGCERSAPVQTSNEEKPNAAASAQPTVPPPRFRIYRAKINMPVSFVVPVESTDAPPMERLAKLGVIVSTNRFRGSERRAGDE